MHAGKNESGMPELMPAPKGTLREGCALGRVGDTVGRGELPRPPVGSEAEGPWRSRMFVRQDWRCARRSASARMRSSEFATVRSHDGATTAPHQAPSAHRSVPSSPWYSKAVPVPLARRS
jgi:hypothetical protein